MTQIPHLKHVTLADQHRHRKNHTTKKGDTNNFRLPGRLELSRKHTIHEAHHRTPLPVCNTFGRHWRRGARTRIDAFRHLILAENARVVMHVHNFRLDPCVVRVARITGLSLQMTCAHTSQNTILQRLYAIGYLIVGLCWRSHYIEQQNNQAWKHSRQK